MKTLFDRAEIHGMKARDISEEDKRDCLKLLHMVREKYGIDAYLYFRNMLAIVVMSQKLDYGGRWISLRRFINRNFDLTDFTLYRHNSKISIVPKKLEKGMAARRLRKFLNIKTIVSAGDTNMDTSMLEYADKTIECEVLKNEGEYINE